MRGDARLALKELAHVVAAERQRAHKGVQRVGRVCKVGKYVRAHALHHGRKGCGAVLRGDIARYKVAEGGKYGGVFCAARRKVVLRLHKGVFKAAAVYFVHGGGGAQRQRGVFYKYVNISAAFRAGAFAAGRHGDHVAAFISFAAAVYVELPRIGSPNKQPYVFLFGKRKGAFPLRPRVHYGIHTRILP